MSVRRCFRFSKVLAVLFTVYVSKRYLDNRPVFRQTKTARLFLFFTCGHFGEPGFMPQAARCSASCKIPFRSIIKTRQISSGFYGGETGICSCLLQSNTFKIFLCFAKVFGQPLKTTHRVVFLTLSFKSLLLSVKIQKRTSVFACPFCLAEKQGFVLAFCKAIRVKYFYALQKPSVSR